MRWYKIYFLTTSCSFLFLYKEKIWQLLNIKFLYILYKFFFVCFFFTYKVKRDKFGNSYWCQSVDIQQQKKWGFSFFRNDLILYWGGKTTQRKENYVKEKIVKLKFQGKKTFLVNYVIDTPPPNIYNVREKENCCRKLKFLREVEIFERSRNICFLQQT